MSDQPPETASRWELKIWAEGQATDADGNPLDQDGNPIMDGPPTEPTPPDESEQEVKS